MSHIFGESVADVMIGDCVESMRKLPDRCVNTCVTSPPYFGLRDYGHAGQIGLEQTPDEYVAKLVDVFREVRRVLRDDGTLWLNLGDSYANVGKWGGSSGGKHVEALHGDTGIGRGKRDYGAGLKNKDLIGIPWMVAFALRADGWYLRQEIIWHKPNPMPESVTDRCTKAHEQLFLLSKSASYFCDMEAIKEDAVGGAKGSNFHTGKTGEHQLGRASTKPRESKKRGDFNAKPGTPEGREPFRAVTETRNRRSVWTIATRPYKGAHFATFPPDLVEPCVIAGCPPGGVVLDPFGGSGTTAGVALRNGRNAILCELNPEYAALVDARIGSLTK
jgi:DNA modification methylase